MLSQRAYNDKPDITPSLAMSDPSKRNGPKSLPLVEHV